MESWQISAIIGIITYISIFVTLKNKTEQHTFDIGKLQDANTIHRKEDDTIHSKLFDRLDLANKEIAELKVKINSVPTMENVRAEFVSKEMFRQMEKHIDDKFDKLENGIEKILNKLEKEKQ